MTAAAASAPGIISRFVNVVLGIKPIFNVAKYQARTMMVKRAASIGIDWPGEVAALRSRQIHPQNHPQIATSLSAMAATPLHPDWETELAALRNDRLVYPDYYLNPFHAYDEGNMGWVPALEVDVAAKTVHAKIWPEAGVQGDAQLRQSYHDVLKTALPQPPTDILDVGCSVGLSTMGLRSLYPRSNCTGVDLSPYFLTVAQYRERQLQPHQQQQQQDQQHQPDITPHAIRWVHAAGEDTGLEAATFDLASIHLVMHELPASVTKAMLVEMRRLLRPGGHVAIMDMNPKSEAYTKMPPYVLTLLKSTEPFLDEYFGLDLEQTIYDAGFNYPTVRATSPRHRTLVAQVRAR
ncbi:MAG: methyltransferase domain-containing protein [Cyanothece sp. SIO2G6]|nr:methyltransferase domain-containing protein [Cyanothece sp. SIO2G6]